MYIYVKTGITHVVPTIGTIRNSVDYMRDFGQRESGIRAFIYSGKRGLHEEFYLPSALPPLTTLDKNVISAWHNSVIQFTIGQDDAWFPILPIQALWLCDNEPYHSWRVSPPTNLSASSVLENPNIPDELFERYAYNECESVRQSIARNPRCPEEIQVAIALLREIAIPKIV